MSYTCGQLSMTQMTVDIDAVAAPGGEEALSGVDRASLWWGLTKIAKTSLEFGWILDGMWTEYEWNMNGIWMEYDRMMSMNM